MKYILRKSPYFTVILGALISCNSPKDETENLTNTSDKQIINSPFSLPEIPASMVVFGQKIDLTDTDIRERLDRELIANSYSQSSTILYFKRANRYFPQIEKALKKNNLPSDLKYLAVIESGLTQAVSPAGAKGIWQFMPETGKEFGLQVNDFVDERLHLEKSTIAACQYLKIAKDSLNDWFLAIAAYNRGMGGVRSDIGWQQTDDYFDTYLNSETSRYVFRLMAIKLIMERPRAYGFDIENIELYSPIATKKVVVENGLKDIAVWAKELGTNYKIIKLLNPWILKNSLPSTQSFEIEIPENSMKLKPRSAYN